MSNRQMVTLKDIEITDCLLDDAEVKLLYAHFLSQPFSLRHRSDSIKQTIHKAQMAHFLDDKEMEIPQVKKIIDSCKDLKTIVKAYVQCYSQSSEPVMHNDNGNKTSITFIHPEYDVNWGGEFILYGKESVGLAIQPLSGRNINFNGSQIAHTGRPFNSRSKTNRFILTVNYVTS